MNLRWKIIERSDEDVDLDLNRNTTIHSILDDENDNENADTKLLRINSNIEMQAMN